MRLQRFTQFGFGVAAAGAAVVFLSGTALAAETSSLGNVTQGLPYVQTSPPITGKASKNFSQSQPGQQSDQDSSKVPTFGSSDKTDVNQTSSTNNSNNANLDSSADSAKSSVQSSAAPSSSDSGDASKSGDISTPVSTPAVKSSDGGNSQADQTKPVIGSKAPSVVGQASKTETTEPSNDGNTSAAPAHTAALVVAYHSAWLRIQPVITNHPAEVDLAAAMPSVPVADKAPVPAKSNGTLGQLTGILAATVVPQLLLPVVDGAYRLALTGLLILVLLSTAVFVFTYGLWLRRGGFATAARSDAPTRNLSSPFATPLSLGYVWTLSRQKHSPILLPVVYEILKPNWFPALSERRIYV
jgi:hypothetical protein